MRKVSVCGSFAAGEHATQRACKPTPPTASKPRTVSTRYVTLPRTTARAAPVALGMLPGSPCQVSHPSSANAAASLASTGKPRTRRSRNLDAQLREAFTQHAHQRCILCPAARHDQLRRARQRSLLPQMRPAESAIRVEDRRRSERRSRRDHVLLRGPACTAQEADARTRRQTPRARRTSVPAQRSTAWRSRRSITGVSTLPLAATAPFLSKRRL